MDKGKLIILVTGGNGFLGSAIVHSLFEKHNLIILEKNVNNLHRIETLKNKVEIFKADLDDISYIFSQRKIDIVIHAATLYGKTNQLTNEIIYTNIYMPVKILEEGIRHGAKAFINTDTFFNSDNANYKYLSTYTQSKKHANDWFTTLSQKIPVINMKLQHMYGPKDNTDKFVMQIVYMLKANIPSIDLTPGEQIRDFIFIDDVVDAYKTVIGKIDRFKCGFNQFHVGFGQGVSIKKFVETIKNLTNASTELRFGALKYRENELKSSIANISALYALGWRPKTDIETGIAKILETI